MEALSLPPSPALTVFLSWVLFRDLVNWKQGTGLFLAAIGVLIILTRGTPENFAAFQPNVGDIVILLATVFVALHNVLLRRVPRQISTLSFMLIIQVIGCFSYFTYLYYRNYILSFNAF